jgi:hypothetical protein
MDPCLPADGERLPRANGGRGSSRSGIPFTARFWDEALIRLKSLAEKEEQRRDGRNH